MQNKLKRAKIKTKINKPKSLLILPNEETHAKAPRILSIRALERKMITSTLNKIDRHNMLKADYKEKSYLHCKESKNLRRYEDLQLNPQDIYTYILVSWLYSI